MNSHGMQSWSLGLLLAVLGGCQGPTSTPPATAARAPTPPKIAEPISPESNPEKAAEPLANADQAEDTATAKQASVGPSEAVIPAAKSEVQPPPVDHASVGGLVAVDSAKTPSDSDVQKRNQTPSPKESDSPTEPRERFLLLTPGGPVVIDVVIRLQGLEHDSALKRLIEEAFKVADEDGDGKATWKDAVRNPKLQSGQFGNLVANTDEEREQLILLYDADRDGFVDREELPRFLTRNAGGGRSFALRSSNEFRSSNRARSAARQLIDANLDGAITADEMDAAPAKLLNRDADDDEIVIVAELKNALDEMLPPQPMMSNRRRTTEPDTAVWLTDNATDINKRWGMVQFLLQELYSFGQRVQASDWPMTPELFKLLDTDGDEELARTELPKLLAAPPHLVLEIRFDEQVGDDRGPRIKLRQLSSEIQASKPVLRERPTRLSLQLPDVELEFFVNEDAALSNVQQVAKAQFTALDRDKNGYLEKVEVPETPGQDATFESFDADQDGKVYEKEVAAYLDQRNVVVRSQVRARAADQEDALFTALDSDGDGRLNSREIHQTPARLRGLDRNADGKLQSHEIPGSMVVAFVRGNAQQDAQLFAAPAAVTQEDLASTGPRWFRGMDANADGEISRREFFGEAEQFTTLDRDQDGFINREEASGR